MDMSFDTHLNSEPKKTKTADVLRKKMGMSPTPRQDVEKGTEQGIVEIEIAKLDKNPHQPRLDMDSEKILELALSIKEQGLLQPITVSPIEGGRYMIRFGHQRVEAVKTLGHETIKAIVSDRPVDNVTLLSEAIVENLQRDDMNIIDTALAMQKMAEFGLEQQEIGKKIGIDKSQVSKYIKILTLPNEIIEDIQKFKTITDRVVIDTLRRIRDEERCRDLYDWYVEDRPSRHDFIQRIKNEEEGKEQRPVYTIKNAKSGCSVKMKALTDDQEKRLNEFIAQLLGE